MFPMPVSMPYKNLTEELFFTGAKVMRQRNKTAGGTANRSFPVAPVHTIWSAFLLNDFPKICKVFSTTENFACIANESLRLTPARSFSRIASEMHNALEAETRIAEVKHGTDHQNVSEKLPASV